MEGQLFYYKLLAQFKCSKDMAWNNLMSNTEMKRNLKIALHCGNKFSKTHWNAKDISVKIPIAFLYSVLRNAKLLISKYWIKFIFEYLKMF